MTWKSMVKKQETDFTKIPEGMSEKSDDYLTAEMLAESRRDYDDYFMFSDVSFSKELKEIVSSMKRLNIDVSFDALVDDKYDGSDGLYNYDERFGLVVRLQMGDIDRNLYFVIPTEGAYTEEGGRPEFYVPRVLQDEDTFIAVLLQSLNIGSGPVKDPASSIRREEQEAYAEWWHSLPYEERADPDSQYPPPIFDPDFIQGQRYDR